MRTSTLLVVLAALVLLVACVAPVYADDVAVSSSSSSSTGSDSSSSSAPSTSSSAASTASFSSSTVPTGNGTSTTSSGSGTTPVTPTINPTQSISITFPNDISTNQTTAFKYEVVTDVTKSLQQATSNTFNGTVTVTSVAPGSTVATVQVTNPPATSAQGLADIIAANRVGSLAAATIGGNAPTPNAASSITIGFAAVAVILAALLQ